MLIFVGNARETGSPGHGALVNWHHLSPNSAVTLVQEDLIFYVTIFLFSQIVSRWRLQYWLYHARISHPELIKFTYFLYKHLSVSFLLENYLFFPLPTNQDYHEK